MIHNLREVFWAWHHRLHLPFWCWDVRSAWNAYPFRMLYLGFWVVGIDRSKAWYATWPHIAVFWNND